MTPREIRRLKYASRGISRLGVTRFGKDQPSTGGSGSNFDPGLTFAVDFSQSTTPSSGPPAPFTFTRATTATVKDFEGIIRSCLSGELRIQGARRVHNVMAQMSPVNKSNDVTTLAQVDSGATTPSANQLTFNASATARGLTQVNYIPPNLASVANRTFRFSADVWVDSGTKDFRLDIVENGVAHNYTAFTATTTVQRFTMLKTFSGSAIGVQGGFQNDAAGTAGTLRIDRMQLEDVTGQTDQSPGDYVSAGVLSSPFHGYFADGVKYFSYENGNTVSSNVVTEAQGPPITGTMGYLVEGQRTNLCLQSQNISTTWTNVRSTETVNTHVAPDGTTTADSLFEDSTLANTHALVQAITFTAAAHTWSIYLKGINRTWARLEVFDGTTSDFAYFQLSGSGAVGTVSGATGTIEALPNGWYRCSVTSTTLAAAGGLYLYVAEADNDITFDGNPSNGLVVWGSQLEAASFASTYIPTTTAAVTRNEDAMSFSTSGIIEASRGTVSLDITDVPSSTANYPVLFDVQANAAADYVQLYVSAAGLPIALVYSGGVQQAAIQGTTDIRGSAARNISVTWAANDVRLYVDGVQEGATDTSATMPAALTTARLMGYSSSGYSPFCGLERMRAFKTNLSAAQVAAL